VRFLIRVATWALAALGIKALYDWLVPRAKVLYEPTSQVVDAAKSSSRELAEHAKAAGTEVLADARDRSAHLREVATDAASDAMTQVDATPKPATPRNGGSTQKASKR
jgi:hypothetical protein